MLDLTDNNLTERIVLHEAADGSKRLINFAPPLISGAGAGWENTKLEHHFVPPIIIPRVGFSGYGLCLEINSAPTAEELRFKQRANKFQVDVSRSKAGDLRGEQSDDLH